MDFFHSYMTILFEIYKVTQIRKARKTRHEKRWKSVKFGAQGQAQTNLLPGTACPELV